VAKTFVSLSKKHLSFQTEIPHLYFVPDPYYLIILKQTQMRQMLKLLAFLLIAAFAITSCKKEVKDARQTEISEEIITKINNLGFSTMNVQKVENGYVVEGDIILTDEYLNQQPTSPQLIIAQEEQYHTFNLVTGWPRAISVSVAASLPTSVRTAVQVAIDRYEAVSGLDLNFSYAGTSGGNIHFSAAPSGSGYIAAAGFPTSSGNPYSSVLFNTAYAGWDAATLASICAHEIGHCIGFRHTDYMKRRYSCGYGGNEGQAHTGVGAVYIDGTATGPDPDSWMLACISNHDDRPFNTNDIKALTYLY